MSYKQNKIIENNKEIFLLHAQIVLPSFLERKGLVWPVSSSSIALDYFQHIHIFGNKATIFSFSPVNIFTEIHKHCTSVKTVQIFGKYPIL